MRKRNVTHVVDTIFWWGLSIMPFIFFILVSISYSSSFIGGLEFFTVERFSFNQSQLHDIFTYVEIDAFSDFLSDTCVVAFTSTVSVFQNGFPNMFDESTSLIFSAYSSVIQFFVEDSSFYEPVVFFLLVTLTWFTFVHVVHLFVDFILFIPRLCHKWMGKAYQED